MSEKSESLEPQGDINFVTHDEPKTSAFVDQVFTWTIDRGRTIVILTAVVVMAIFVIRQKLATDLANVIEEIGPNKSIVENSLEKQAEYRAIQARVGTISNLINNQINWQERLAWFNTKIPQSIEKKNLKYDSETISLTAESPDSNGFVVFITNLISDDRIRSIVIKSSRFINETDGYSFEVQVLIEK